MQTNFTAEQLQNPSLAEAESILRKCVHCGFCTATCPTFVTLGDELDSPRGRIYLMKDMLENEKPATEEVVKHVDRCLTCLSCMTTCPSGVDYNHLVEIGRAHIEETYERPFMDKTLRTVLQHLLPYTNRFRASMIGGYMARPFARFLPESPIRAMLEQAVALPHPPTPTESPRVFPAAGARKKRVAMLTGCVQPALKPQINEATMRLLTRYGVEVITAKGQGCCGALPQHMGKEEAAKVFAKANIDAWWKLWEEDGGLDAVVMNASGCGSTVKDYGHLFAEDDDQDLAMRAKKISELTMDITEFLDSLGLSTGIVTDKPTKDVTVAYHAACSLQHGQQVRDAPKALLRAAGFDVREIADSHLCCGSAGTYSILQPEMSKSLRARKVETLEAESPDVIAAGNIGCISHIGQGTEVPVIHTVELLDWATGGPAPEGLPEGVV